MNHFYKITSFNILFFLTVTIFLSNNLFCQKETYNWFFGDSAAISFLPNGQNAHFISGGATKQMEGTATISDKNGNLLFYSDGITVWNKNHQKISIGYDGKGLKGNNSSSRSAIIIPKPRSNRYYYTFTIDAWENSDHINNVNKNGLRYSIIDVLGDNQNGKIIPEQKNILLLENAVEKMVTVNHSNKTDAWLIAFNWKNNSFYSYLITKDGINSPQIFKKSSENTTNLQEAMYNLEYDIENSKLICCEFSTFSFIIYDFNPQNGRIDVENPIILPAFPENISEKDKTLFRPYSGVFSKDGKKFYGTCFQRNLLQYDFSLQKIDEIIASRTVIADSNNLPNDNYTFGAIRRGPDDKIYVARDKCDYLGIINEPDKAGISCNFNSKGIFLEGKKSRYGLPIMMNYSTPPCDFSGFAGGNKFVCAGTEAILGDFISETENMTFEWTPKTYLDNPNSLNPICKPQKTTQYILKIQDEELGCFDFDTIIVTVQNPPSILKANDVEICENSSVIIGNSANSNNFEYEWNPKLYLENPYSKTTICAPEEDMEYILTVTDNATGCVNFDTVNVKMKAIEVKILGSDFICEGVNTVLTVEGDYDSYIWSTGEKTQSITVDSEGEYSVTVTDSKGCVGKKTIKVKYLISDNFKIIAPEIICFGSSATISTDGNFAKYIWSTGENTPTINITKSGKYWVTVENENGCKASDTVEINESKISYKLLENNVDFGNLCAEKFATKLNSIANIGNEEFVISNIKLAKNNSGFEIEKFAAPISLKSNETKNISINFQPNLLGNYFDTLLIEISFPCETTLKIPLFGTSAHNNFILTSENLKITPGEILQIPININYESNSNKNNPEFEANFEISYNKNILKIFETNFGNIIDRKIDGETETIKISTVFPENSQKIELICKAETTLGSEIISNFATKNFQANIECFEVKNLQNTVELIGCAIDFRPIIFFEPTNLGVFSRNNSIICDISSAENGEFVLKLFNNQGIEIASKIWNKTNDNFAKNEVIFDCNYLSNGLYLVALQSKKFRLTKKVLLTK